MLSSSNSGEGDEGKKSYMNAASSQDAVLLDGVVLFAPVAFLSRTGTTRRTRKIVRPKFTRASIV